MKICLLIVISSLTMATSHAQSFLTDADTASLITDGYTGEDDEFFNRISTNVSYPISISWQVVTPTNLPSGWSLVSVYDSKNTYNASDAWTTGAVRTGDVLPGNVGYMDFVWKINIAYTAVNATRIVKFRFFEGTTSDTLYYLITKEGGTGINIIKVNDDRVVIYPNPATNNINLFVNKDLKASTLSVIDIKGSQLAQLPLNTLDETTKLNLGAFSPGIYLIQIQNEEGAILTTRKITKI